MSTASEALREAVGGHPLEPEQVMLIYWFAQFPAEPVVLPYNAMQYGADIAYLSAIMAEITACADPIWRSSADGSHCRFCTYCSLCGHAIVTGIAGEDDQAPDLDIDLTQIEEIAY